MQDQLNPEVHLTLPSSHSPFCSQYSSQGKLFSAYSMLVLPWGFETCCLPWMPNLLKPLWSHLLQSSYRLKISHTCIHFPVSICWLINSTKKGHDHLCSLLCTLYLAHSRRQSVHFSWMNEWLKGRLLPPEAAWSPFSKFRGIQLENIALYHGWWWKFTNCRTWGKFFSLFMSHFPHLENNAYLIALVWDLIS